MTAIDRRTVVGRHDVVLREPDAQVPLSVGNGDFACTVDVTGMQTFTAFHDPTQAGDRLVTNTCTQSTWGWHEMPGPGYEAADAMTPYETARGPVDYPDQFDMFSLFGVEPAPELAAGTWLHVNPQRIDLGRTGLVLRSGPDAAPETDPSKLTDVHQRLDLWSGTIHSSFAFDGEPVSVTTAAHPTESQVVFRIESPLLTDGRLAVRLAFPYASDDFFLTSDWTVPDGHATTVHPAPLGARIVRVLDDTTYTVRVGCGTATVRSGDEPHVVVVDAPGDTVDLVVTYADGDVEIPPGSVDETFAAAASWWETFWSSGAAVDFGACTDPRAPELERRVVLSQYLTAVNCSGSLPPQETGLVANSWNGKFHLEMHWWHAAHFAPWGRGELLERSLDWYLSALPAAEAWADHQGYDGARWPKQVGPDGRDSPNETGPFLVWQQPHLLYFLELLHRTQPDPARVERFAEAVDATARFMASFVEERADEFHLLPPLIPAQENYDRHTTEDPTFELAYWWWGLEIAQQWRERRELPRDERWADVQARLARPARLGDGYAAVGVEPYLRREDHPSLVAALGVVPSTPLVDAEVMTATLLDVVREWDWESTWGWDFPMVAMTAARLGDPELAVDALLMDRPKNEHLRNGHNAQRGNRLPVYLPGNGGLLAAVSLMAGGWDGAQRPAPGFPADGGWDVAVEGFTPWP